MTLTQRIPRIVPAALTLSLQEQRAIAVGLREESARCQERSVSSAASAASVCPLNLDARPARYFARWAMSCIQVQRTHECRGCSGFYGLFPPH